MPKLIILADDTSIVTDKIKISVAKNKKPIEVQAETEIEVKEFAEYIDGTRVVKKRKKK